MKVIKDQVALGWAKEHTKEEAQRLVTRFQQALAAAIIEVGNEGLDPAGIASMMINLAEGVGFSGIGVLKGVEGVELPEINPVMAAHGGNPTGMLKDMLARIDEGRRTHKIANEEEELEDFMASIPAFGKRVLN